MINYRGDYIIIKGDEKQVETFYRFMNWANEKSTCGWIGEIGDLLGVVDTRDGYAYRRGTNEYVPARSTIEFIELYKDEVRLNVIGTDTLEVYKLLQEKFASDCELITP